MTDAYGLKGYVMALIAVVSFYTAQGQPTTRYQEGVMALQDARYKEAQDHFTSILENNEHSAGLYYNLGLAHYYQNDIGQAIINFERALLLNPQQKEAINALKTAREKIELPITKIEDFILWRWYRHVLNLFSSNMWSFLQIAAGLLVMVSLFLLLYGSPAKKWRWSILLMTAIFLFIWCWYAAYQRKQLQSGGEAAIVLESRVFIFEAPDLRSDPVSEISEGEKVYLIDSIGTWLKVQLLDKDIGWIQSASIEII